MIGSNLIIERVELECFVLHQGAKHTPPLDWNETLALVAALLVPVEPPPHALRWLKTAEQWNAQKDC